MLYGCFPARQDSWSFSQFCPHARQSCCVTRNNPNRRLCATTSATTRSGPIRTSMTARGPPQNGLVPSRSRDTDRFLWVRLRVPVPGKLNGPVALHLDDLGVQPNDVAGFRHRPTPGRPGGFPSPPRSHRSSRFSGDDSAFFARSAGAVVVVALREWHAPAFFESRSVSSHSPRLF
jgi:hypothetical protein